MQLIPDKTDLLDKKLAVAINEFNDVLNEIQVSITGIARGTKMALETLSLNMQRMEVRLQALEKQIGVKNVTEYTDKLVMDAEEEQALREGKEL